MHVSPSALILVVETRDMLHLTLYAYSVFENIESLFFTNILHSSDTLMYLFFSTMMTTMSKWWQSL